MSSAPANALNLQPDPDPAPLLLATAEAVARELHPGRRFAATLDSSLDRDLALDSLGRVELCGRIERRFNVSLPETALAESETLRDLLRAVRAAGPASPARLAGVVAEAPPASPGAALPEAAETLVETLAWHVRQHPQRTHVVVIGADESEENISYAQLQAAAGAVAGGLLAKGLQPGETVAIMLPTSPDYFYAFFGVLLAGGIPVPVYPPPRSSQLVAHIERSVGIFDNALARLLIAPAEAAPLARRLAALAPTLRAVVSPAELAAAAATPPTAAARPGDVALIQYTSGSTGAPKGVVLTHANLLANVRAMGRAANADSTDVFVSWLPLYHDMGLICAWFSSLYFAMRFVVMSPLAFIARPARWLRAIHRHGGTLSGGPNFAYELCLRKIDDSELDGIDLSPWRIAFNGAEPVSAETLRRFAERFAAHGLRREAITPVYGLAECCVGLAMTAGRGPLIDRVRRSDFVAGGHAVPAAAGAPDTLQIVACGRALPGHSIRVVDAAGRELPDRREGRLQFRGPSATSGYHRNAEATRRLFDGDWLDSGDLAYLVDGEIYPTGRAKDMIIRAGRNLYPQEIEEAVGRIAGIRPGGVAAFGAPDPASGTERLVVLAEARAADAATLDRLRGAVQERVVAVLGEPADDVVVTTGHVVLKTSSGKIRRAATRDRYLRGAAPRREELRALGRLLATRLRLAAAGAGRRLWGLHAHGMFWLLAPLTWCIAASLPRPAWSWAVCRAAARLLLALTGTRLVVEGEALLAAAPPCVLVANHASYLDGVILVAALPWRHYRFVAKRELRERFVPRRFLTHLGADFVDRIDTAAGVEDAARQVEAARRGASPIFFPEGTFGRGPGLLPFRMGAFVTAAQAGLPVVPLTLRGTRTLLPDGVLWPHRSLLRVIVGTPLAPTGSDWPAALALRDAARREILARCGEPDLA